MSNSLARFVKEVCACWTDDPREECLGVDAFSIPFREPGKCWVLEGKSCPYFKDCVLGPEDYPYPHLGFVKDPRFEKRVRKQYKKIDHTVVEADIRRCPDCGAALMPRQRYCERCRKWRRRETNRENQRRFYRKQRTHPNTV
jgi:hypothetical protein